MVESREPTPVLTQGEIDQRVFDLYDEYCHGRLDRRAFLQRAAVVTIGGLAMAQALLPRYAQAQTISFTDPRIKARYVGYPSPGGTSGTMRGYLVQPEGPGPFSAVLVIHENPAGCFGIGRGPLVDFTNSKPVGGYLHAESSQHERSELRLAVTLGATLTLRLGRKIPTY